jgi:hypothetical protein
MCEKNADGSLPIHRLSILLLRLTRKKVTPGYRHHQALGGRYYVGQHPAHTIPPDTTVYAAVRTRARRAAAFHPPSVPRLRAVCPIYFERTTDRRALLVLFTVIPWDMRHSLARELGS